MSETLQISVTKLAAGDSITFDFLKTSEDPDGNNNLDPFVLNIVSSDVLEIDQVQETATLQPISRSWDLAVTRFVNAMKRLSWVTSVERESDQTSVVIIKTDKTLEFQGFAVNDANGTLFNFVSYYPETDGIVRNEGNQPLYFGPILVPNIRITSVSYESVDFPLKPSVGFTQGNLLERVKATINFTTAESITGKLLDYNYGFVENSTVYYTNVGSEESEFKINNEFFLSPVTGAGQGFAGELGTLSAKSPIYNQDDNVEIISLGGNDYELTHEFYLFFAREDDLNDNIDGLSSPTFFQGKEALKHIFEVNVKSSAFSSLLDETTSQQDLRPFIQAGNTGYLEEVYNTGTRAYTFDSFVWNNAQNELNSSQNSVATAVINTNNITPVTTDLINIRIQNVLIPGDERTPITSESNLFLDSVQIPLDGSQASSTNILNASATINGSQIEVTFTIKENTYLETYAIIANCYNEVNQISNAVDLKVSTAVNDANTDTIQLGTYPSAPAVGFHFLTHYQADDVTKAFDQITASTEDIQSVFFQIIDSGGGINELINFQLLIQDQDSNTVLERLILTADQLPYSDLRNFVIDPSSTRIQVSATETSTGIYDFIYAFQFWEGWANYENVAFVCQARFRQTLPDGSKVSFTKEFVSSVINSYVYDATITDNAEPQVLRQTIEYLDPVTLDDIGRIRQTGKTLIRATFTDTNPATNDLGLQPLAPENYVYETLLLFGGTGYLNINDQNNAQGKNVRFHAHRPNVSTFWEEVSGYPSYNAKVERLTFNSIKIEGVVDGQAIADYFGGFDCLKVSARIDKVREPIELVCFIVETVANVPIDVPFDLAVVESPATGQIIWELQEGTQFNQDALNIVNRTGLGTTELNGVQQEVCLKQEVNNFLNIEELYLEGNQIVGTPDTTAVTFSKLDRVFANNNALDGFIFDSWIQKENLLVEFRNNGLVDAEINTLLNDFITKNAGDVSTLRVISLIDNSNGDNTTITLVNTLKGFNVDTEIINFNFTATVKRGGA